jgi:hypothetical protein
LNASRVIVPFGTFSAKQEKTVLMKLRIPADKEGLQPVVDAKLAYRDFVHRSDGSCAGSLAVNVTDEASAQRDLDPFVAARIERSRTAQTLTDANFLFAQGRVDEARARLQKQDESLAKTEASAKHAAATRPVPMPSNKALGLDQDFGNQRRVVQRIDRIERPRRRPRPGWRPRGEPLTVAPITRERAERIARAHACVNCGEYSFKKLAVKPANPLGFRNEGFVSLPDKIGLNFHHLVERSYFSELLDKRLRLFQ